MKFSNFLLSSFILFFSINVSAYWYEAPTSFTPEQEKMHKKYKIQKIAGHQVEYNPTWQLKKSNQSCQLRFNSSRKNGTLFDVVF